jgi:hypothetical protein
MNLIVPVTDQKQWTLGELQGNLIDAVQMEPGSGEELFSWGEYLLLPLSNDDGVIVGVMGILAPDAGPIDEEQQEGLLILGERAALALEDQRLQQQVFASLKSLTPQVELIQRLRAASRYDRGGALVAAEDLPAPVDLAQYVRDALTHYWGGPKLTKSPLMRWVIVQQALEEQGNPVNALRSILKEAIERVRPEGERRFTAEWILYNILELKFMQGRKVREVAMRLAMSEADLYRKQRIAIDAVAQVLIDMEKQARQEKNGNLLTTE